MPRVCPTRLAAILTLSATAAWAQVPAGSQFRVNFTDYGHLHDPGLAVAPDGSFVVTFWEFGFDRALARFFDATGAGMGREFRLAEPARSIHQGATYLRNGHAVLAWRHPVFQPSDIKAARFAPPNLIGSVFAVNTFTTGVQYDPTVAALSDGGFAVVWTGPDPTEDYNVWVRRFHGDGSADPEMRVNTYTLGGQVLGSVAPLPGGGFIVAWIDDLQESVVNGTGIFGQRFGAGGATLGAEFHVNSYVTGNQRDPVVAADPSGAFVVVWHSQGGQDGSGTGVFGQRYDAHGAPVGPEFRVNTYSAGSQYSPRVAMDATGNFMVAFRDNSQVKVRRFRSDGSPRGAEFAVTPLAFGASMGADPAGNFVVVWEDTFVPEPGLILGQRFGGLRPAAWSLQESGDGNGVFEAGESASVMPSWRNGNGQAQTFQGTATFTGPPGAAYTLLDGSSDYGTVADGAIASCTAAGDCLSVGVSPPSPRPAVHWDAVLVETIVPDAHGQVNRMLLHLGESFSDMPRGSPYYRFVETLLHRGVTAGCAGSVYCTTSSTAREQMAVFVLAAKEGAGYAPPPCGPPMFADVPASSPYCRWIEELARRGVTAGCGGGNWCPSMPVPREQMAVFLLRTLDPSLEPPACEPPNVFADVPETSTYCRWIEEMARRGITGGCAAGLFCPAAAVTREEMAPFLAVTFGLTLYGS